MVGIYSVIFRMYDPTDGANFKESGAFTVAIIEGEEGVVEEEEEEESSEEPGIDCANAEITVADSSRGYEYEGGTGSLEISLAGVISEFEIDTEHEEACGPLVFEIDCLVDLSVDWAGEWCVYDDENDLLEINTPAVEIDHLISVTVSAQLSNAEQAVPNFAPPQIEIIVTSPPVNEEEEEVTSEESEENEVVEPEEESEEAEQAASLEEYESLQDIDSEVLLDLTFNWFAEKTLPGWFN